jgi:hypothetical protein
VAELLIIRIVSYLFLGSGIWLLYQAWRGVNPKVWNPGSKAGQQMRGSTRAIFLLGGITLAGFGMVLIFSLTIN